jgi:ribonuclease D
VQEGFLYVNNRDGLAALCEKLRTATWLAVDTEFERERTYYPELCLLQVAGREVAAVVDFLTIPDITPLFDLLYGTGRLKVFHSARQDLEIFFHLQDRVPTPLFDTQIAAGLLGYDKQLGYANLVEKVLGKILDKSQTRTNWKRRPLRPGQLQYAADDVIYLARIYEQLAARLSTGQLDTLRQECALLENPELYAPDPATMWRKVRQAKQLTDEQVPVFKELAAWREVTARRENLPRKWLLSDHAMMAMARSLPVDMTALGALKDIDKAVLRRHGAALLALLDKFRK